jgi:site-specific DNA recombinase
MAFSVSTAMSATHTRRGNRLYRYYVSHAVLKHGPEACPVRRVPAGEIEAAVIGQLRGILHAVAESWLSFLALRPCRNDRVSTTP